MKNQSSENKLVITEEFIFDQNKLSKDLINHSKVPSNIFLHFIILTKLYMTGLRAVAVFW